MYADNPLILSSPRPHPSIFPGRQAPVAPAPLPPASPDFGGGANSEADDEAANSSAPAAAIARIPPPEYRSTFNPYKGAATNVGNLSADDSIVLLDRLHTYEDELKLQQQRYAQVCAECPGCVCKQIVPLTLPSFGVHAFSTCGSCTIWWVRWSNNIKRSASVLPAVWD